MTQAVLMLVLVAVQSLLARFPSGVRVWQARLLQSTVKRRSQDRAVCSWYQGSV